VRQLVMRAAAVVLGVSLAGAGCAPPSISPPAVREASAYPAKASRAGLTVAADPYADPDKSKAVFGVELVRKGLLAVNLIFKNDGPKKFFVYTNQITFKDANGESHPRLQVTQVGRRLGDSLGGRWYYRFWHPGEPWARPELPGGLPRWSPSGSPEPRQRLRLLRLKQRSACDGSGLRTRPRRGR
jgi:hypothetical protein